MSRMHQPSLLQPAHRPSRHLQTQLLGERASVALFQTQSGEGQREDASELWIQLAVHLVPTAAVTLETIRGMQTVANGRAETQATNLTYRERDRQLTTHTERHRQLTTHTERDTGN